MNYFERKANQLYTKIHEAKIDNKNITGEEIEKIIEVSLREVALDQKYKCSSSLEGEADYYEVRRLQICVIEHSNLEKE